MNACKWLDTDEGQHWLNAHHFLIQWQGGYWATIQPQTSYRFNCPWWSSKNVCRMPAGVYKQAANGGMIFL
jgi:hypothetical protein